MNRNRNSDANLLASRRDILKAAGAMAAVAAAGITQHASAADMGHSHQHHQHTVDLDRMRLVDHALDCVKKGEACAQHCIELFKIGDTSVASCADAVQEMLPACMAVSKLATYDSRHLKDMIRVCTGICEDCEKECRKHADKHAECKACGDSCADFIRVCKDYVAA